MRGIVKVSLVLLLFAASNKVKAQVDPHFSQYYVYPSWLNPAMTGVFDGNYRISGIYRNQWNTISQPFVSTGATVDFNTEKTINYGVSLLNQSAGDGGYNYLSAYGSASYTGLRFGLNGTKRFVFGMQAGILNRRFDPSKFTTSEQWDPQLGFDPNKPITDIPNKTSASSFDAGAGVLYYDGTPGQKTNIYAGFSAAHLTRPEDPFGSTSAAIKEKLPVRYTFHGGLRISASENFAITPNVLFLKQGKSQEIMVGGYAQIKAAAATDFIFGANYRFDDAISPYIGFYHKNLVLGASYDINTSDLGKMVRGTNAFEISLSFIGRKSYKAQEQDFVCPRL